MNIGRQVDSFFHAVAAGTVAIYNEFSLQHELGLTLRNAVLSPDGRFRVEFERPVGFFGLKAPAFGKKEIDISIVSVDGSERVAIELKFPRRGQHPEQMFKFCQDIAFVEQIVQAGFSDGYFIAAVDDRLFYSGSAVGIYGHFRGGVPIHGVIQKPTGKRDETVSVCGSYTIVWREAGPVKYTCLRVNPAERAPIG